MATAKPTLANPPIEINFNLQRPAPTGQPAFHLQVQLQLPGQGVSAIFGHSGSGKTTLLRCIAGLETVPNGFLRVAGQTWQDGKNYQPTHRRPLGYVFQEASLFEHLNSRDNLRYAAKRRHRRRNLNNSRHSDTLAFDQVVQLLGLEPLLSHYPQQLSGGEKQRVAIARALLINPQLLLMDEPLASLDHERKQEILPYLERLRRELAIPIIYVSHSTNEVARLADHLVALENGQVVAQGPLTETLARLDFPITLGEDAGVVLDATVQEIDNHWQLAKVAFSGGELWLRDHGLNIGQSVRVRILARDISLARQHPQDTSILNLLPGCVQALHPDQHPAMQLVQLKVGASQFIARITRRSVHHLQLAPGQTLWLQIKSAALVR